MSGQGSSGSVSTSSHFSAKSANFDHFSASPAYSYFFLFSSTSFSVCSFSSFSFAFFAAVSMVCTSFGAAMLPRFRDSVYFKSFVKVRSKPFSSTSSRTQLDVNDPGLNFSTTITSFRIPLVSDQKILRASSVSGLIRSRTTRPVFQTNCSSSLRVGVRLLLMPDSSCSIFAVSSLIKSSKYELFFDIALEMRRWGLVASGARTSSHVHAAGWR
mmetsp:Transcript_38832/g.77003  ORF Transcript_38832/g.77003 Transcript_38832/m.77003 type:complete len:214 (+) Transcript_38832:219-860(+)